MTDSPDADPPLSCGWAIDRSLRNWILMTLYTFIGWGLVFACFANIKHDLQDIFIQRVKFLASYAVYALWIGCGALFLVDRIIPSLDNRRGLRILGMGLACLLPLVPIANNAYNYRLVKAVGAVEQNGHDFGWQFGNYQLRGADAILEEITEHEEPPPNPCFPPEMTPDAIFFGGTDPGRFVPTYMIYSARVREDVYLITQNALADNTYMSVMRDLYGDRIWIPAQPDSAQAFKIYVDEVKAGKRPKNADLKIENGRVQVSGALGVMEINGILAEMIFNRNNYRHGFYVEESYVIRWMFPYLTPHGLIMKINPKQVHVDALKREARNDLDFWDWFTRRLLTNPTFDRDVCAQKSFSKLRSAIGGLYAARGLVHAAETAFREARTLYPLSPEANFRLVQEVFLRAGRFEEAKAMIRDFSGRDPGNTKIEGFYKQVEAAERVTRSIQDLEAKARARKLDLRGALDLCNLYLNSKMMDKFDKLTSDLMANTNLPPTFLYTLAQLLERGDRVPKMVTALDRALPGLPQNAPPEIYLKMATLYAKGQRLDRMSHVVEEYYLKKNPTDWKAWLDLASLKLNLKDKGGATRALEQALRFGGRQAAGIARRDRRFDPIIEDATKRAQKRIGLPTPSGLPGTDPRFPRSGPLR